MVRIEKVCRRFGPVKALQNVSFSAKGGEALGLLGPNGAGKTTMIRILTGTLRPDAGRVEIDGVSVEDDPLGVKKRIGYLPENNPVYPEMSISGYLGFVGRAKGLASSDLDAAVARVVRDCGLQGWEHRTLGKLSKGYRQRLGLAAALVNDPALLILDEPTSGLDPEQIVEFRSLIGKLKRQRTVLLSTHILADVGAVCDRIAVLRKGSVIAVNTVEALEKRLRPQAEWNLLVQGPGEEIEKAFGQVSGLMDLSLLPGEGRDRWKIRALSLEEDDPRQDFVCLIVDRGWKLLEMSPGRLSLEDVFLGLMTEESE